MTIVEDFINKFHNLEGISLKERKKSLHHLLINIEDQYLDEIIKTLKPATYLEETFRIEILIYFKRTTDLLDILMSGEEIGACQILKHGWFVRDLMKKYSPFQFVEELTPNLSLSVRSKIFKKLLIHFKDESKIQALFQELHETYGLKVASTLLPGCSTEKIKDCLVKNSIDLSASQLKLLFDKDKTLIKIYFEELNNNGKEVDNYKLVSFFDYIGRKDPLFYFELTKKFRIYMRKLGRKSTKKFIDLQRKEVLENPKDFIDFLRKDSLVRKLGEDFPKLYKKLLPKSLSNFKYRMGKTLLKYYNKDKQYELFYKTFEEMYKESLWDNSIYMDEKLIEFIPDRAERYKWITKFEKRGNIKKYNARKKYARYQCAMSFIEDDGKTAIKERKTIFNTLISTCKLTKDYDAFLNILKSFCERHKNSDITISYNFLRSIYNELNMQKLTEEHWKYIYEIIAIQLFKKQQIFQPIFVEYIKFLYSQNKSIEKYIYTILNEAPLNLTNFEYGTDEFQKTMLHVYIKLLPEINEKNIVLQIALSIIKWNWRHPTEKIDISKQRNILNSIMQLNFIERINPDEMKVFKYLICQQDANQTVSDLDRIYWENFKSLNDNTITKWFVKYKPMVLKDNLDKVGIMLKAKNSLLVRSLKKYDHIDIASIITTLCLEELKNCQPSKRRSVIRILVLFMPRKVLLNFFKKYIPERCKSEEDEQGLYEIQCALVRYLKLTVNLKQYLPDLLKYCHGDFLKFALPSLYSSFCRIPENQLYFALEDLNAQPAVSVRKHSIFLSSLILPVDKVLLKYKEIQTEKNFSVKQHMFLSCYKYFSKNVLHECWVIMAQYISKLKKHQKEIIKLLINVDEIPKQYRASFTEHVWATFDKLKKEGVKSDDNMISLLRNLSKRDVMNLRDEFCTGVIENKLFDLEKCSMEHWVFDFARKFLLYGENTEKKIKMIFNVLHIFKEFCFSSGKKIEGLKIINQFCFSLIEDFFGDEENAINKSFPKLYRDAWTKEFNVEETFEENLMIDFVLFKTEPNVATVSFPEEMSESYSVTLKKYGNLITNNFRNFLSGILDLICKGDDAALQRINFLLSFLEQNYSSEHCILVIELLPPLYRIEDAEIEYKKLINMLMLKDEIVRIHLFGKLKSEQY